MDCGVRGIGGEIKLFPPPPYHGELQKWEDWSWQLKRYVGLYKPPAKTLMDAIEGNPRTVVDDDMCEAYDVQQTRSQNNQLSLFSKQWAYMLAQITDGSARAIVRNEDTENGFEIRRRLYNQFSLPTRARATNHLKEIIAFRLRHDHLESDLSTIALPNENNVSTMPTVPEVQYENITGEQLAVDLAALTGRPIDEIKNEGVQATLASLHLTGRLQVERQDMVRLATGEFFVRPTASVRVNPENAGVLIVDAEIGNESPNAELSGNQAIDAAMGIRPRPTCAPSVGTAAGKGVGKNGAPAEALRLMNETLTPHRLSRNGPVNLEVSAALARMDLEKDVTKIWQRLDEFITSDSRSESDKIVSEACAIADRLYNAQVGLAEAVYRREWNDEWAPILSFVIPGTRYAMTRAERMFLTKGNWHLEWKNTTNAKENLVHDLVNVYDWVMLPSNVGEELYQTGTIALSQFPCHQLNGSFCALSATRKTVQGFCQDCFEENAAHEGVVFIVRRRTKLEAHRNWVEASNGKMKLENHFNRSRGIIRMPLTDVMMRSTNGPPAALPCGNGIMEPPGDFVPQQPAYGAGLHHDCSTWDELYEEDDGENANAWNGPTSSSAMASKKNASTASSGPATVLSQVANALTPGAEVVLRMNSKAMSPNGK
ncbi:unnamed protein product [Symbiodinium sp. CCMP2456]|nr:unnamed protein product [Symbiodinium sp. CCMP2456]